MNDYSGWESEPPIPRQSREVHVPNVLPKTRHNTLESYVTIYDLPYVYPNLTCEHLLEEIEVGRRVSHAFEDEMLGFGPMFDYEVELYFRKRYDRIEPFEPRKWTEEQDEIMESFMDKH